MKHTDERPVKRERSKFELVEVWATVTIANAGLTGLFTIKLGVLGILISFVFFGVGLTLYAYPRSKWAGITAIVVNILCILLYSTLLPYIVDQPTLWLFP